MKHKPKIGDHVFNLILRIAIFIVIGAFVVLVLTLVGYSIPVIQKYGTSYFFGTTWRPNATDTKPEAFGAFSYIFGTIVTSIIALIMATPIAVGSALFIAEYAPIWIKKPLIFLIELLMIIPSVAYGIWGLFVLVPFMRDTVQPWLQNSFGSVPVLGELFQGQIYGQSLLTAGILLAIMILPTIMTLSYVIISQVPKLQKEGALALAATKQEMLFIAILPFAKRGILGAMMLGLARAFGETMAVTMVVGNASSAIKPSLYTPGYTIASAIANQFTEANSPIHFSAIVGLGLILVLVACGFNIISRMFVSRMSHIGDNE